MELRHIKYFVVLAELKHFHKAAAELNITQPSLSKSLQKLELLVGGKLFQRDSKNMTLTPLGEMVLAHSQNIVKQHDNLKRDIASFHGENEHEISIGASPIPSNCLVGPILGQFIQACPKMTIDFKVDHWQSLTELLLQGKLDLFVAEAKVTELEDNPLLHLQALPPFPVIFCCRPDHPLTKLPRLYLATFRDYPLAIPLKLPITIANQFEDLFQLQRDDFAGLIRFDQLHSIKDAIFHSDLVVLTPEIAVRDELLAGTLVQLSPQLMPKLNAKFSIVSLAENQQSQSIKVFSEFIVQRANSVKDSVNELENLDIQIA
ncbi:LysR family transcriptional regulator [Shewanella sp. 5_MG-2023]|uniref:LysR family transcriptional regulator n=1 Tax=Shewanella sp. 5_MG-2023 TaxID=3062656 RepID=UPI0026E2654C|nr:LysR family transcriptional regulator [Shewanella sp. 5_MG-2023]MDO6641298.1 LysR family transcriptional regulator [Shewanella sp. 5_MG-2023]